MSSSASSSSLSLSADHPKLEAFQSAVKTLLLKRIEEVEDQARQIQKENQEKKAVRLAKTKELHEAQRTLQASSKLYEYVGQVLYYWITQPVR